MTAWDVVRLVAWLVVLGLLALILFKGRGAEPGEKPDLRAVFVLLVIVLLMATDPSIREPW